MPLTKPTVGGSLNTWGTLLNLVIDAVNAFASRIVISATATDVAAFDIQTDNGGGSLSRFTIENNPGGGAVDINFRSSAINIGNPDPGVDGDSTSMDFCTPLGNTSPAFRVHQPGDDPNDTATFYVGYMGDVSIQCGGLAATALTVKTGGDANSKYTITETGVVNWGAGAGSSLDTNLYRSAAAVLKTDGAFAIGAAVARSGTGSPESVVTAPVGSTFHRTDGGAGTCLYVKESGSGNTGWVAK